MADRRQQNSQHFYFNKTLLPSFNHAEHSVRDGREGREGQDEGREGREEGREGREEGQEGKETAHHTKLHSGAVRRGSARWRADRPAAADLGHVGHYLHLYTIMKYNSVLASL